MKTLISHLLGDTRTTILAQLLLHPEKRVHVRELSRTTGVSPGALHRELTALVSFGVLAREEVGRQVFYSADRSCPVFEDLAGLLRKTAGLVDVLAEAIEPYRDHVEAAFVYGSMASGKQGIHSDVDVMLVGDISFSDAVRAFAPTQEKLRREVNPIVMKASEFRRKLRERDGFVRSTWKSPKLWIAGRASELG